MKKIISLILSVILTAAACAGCGVAQSESGFPAVEQSSLPVQTADPVNAAPASGLPSLSDQIQSPGTYRKPQLIDTPLAEVNVDAKIVLPDVDSIPEAQVSAADFTQEQADAAIQYLFENAVIYDQPTQKTKKQIQEEIDSVNKNIQRNGDAYGTLEQDKEYVRELEDQLKTAPDTIPPQVSNGKLRELQYMTFGYKPPAAESFQGIDIYADLGKSKPAIFRIQNNYNFHQTVTSTDATASGIGQTTTSTVLQNRQAEMVFDNDAQKQEYYNVAPDGEDTTFFNFQPLNVVNGEPQGGAPQGLATTPQQALDQAQSLLKVMGASMSLYAMKVETPNLSKLPAAAAKAIKGYAVYKMSFIRNTNGVDSLYALGQSMSTGQWFYESCEISVNDSGILSLEWWSPLAVKSTVPQTQKLLPFSNISEIFEQTMKTQFPADKPDGNFPQDIYEVNKVQLGYFRVVNINSVTDGTLVPAWGFYGYVKRGLRNGAVDPNSNGDAFPFLLVNAENGNVILQDRGY